MRVIGLRDGLTMKMLRENYSRILDHKAVDSILGLRDGELVWYDQKGLPHTDFERILIREIYWR